jgi:hypothetical protein
MAAALKKKPIIVRPSNNGCLSDNDYTTSSFDVKR